MAGELPSNGPAMGPVPPEYLDQAALDIRMPSGDPAVQLLAKTRYELDKKTEETEELKMELEAAQKDPLTGAWNRGPGFMILEEMMSLVENVQAGLVEGEDLPNAIMGIGIDIEAMHHTNAWYGQKGGDARVVHAGQELREVVDAVRTNLRTHDRRNEPREGHNSRPEDLLIRTGGDELMLAMAVRITEEKTREKIAGIVIDRMADTKERTIPDQRITYAVGFFEPGQTPDDFYYSVEPKGRMGRMYKLARPIFKAVRFGLGQYKPPLMGEL